MAGTRVRKRSATKHCKPTVRNAKRSLGLSYLEALLIKFHR